VYQSYTFGKVGKQVTIILLDGRYFKNEQDGSLLGEEQWKWLDQTFAETPDSQLYLIGSGIQILPTDKILGEKWAAYPSERSRLIASIKQANLTGVVSLLSGDVHLAEFNCMEAGLTHPLLEVTSSGLTHAWGATGEFKFVPAWLSYLSRFLSFVLPSRYQLNTIEYQRNISSVHGLNYYLDLNFGSVSIDWASQNFTVSIHNVGGDVVFDHTVSFNKSVFQNEHVTCDEHNAAREFVGPHLARSIVVALVAVASLDVWLVVYLGYLFVQWMLFPENEEQKKLKAKNVAPSPQKPKSE
jgi:phosphodiesterase/alkaline phosphatase D-like protein